jgi:hypothetical protein
MMTDSALIGIDDCGSKAFPSSELEFIEPAQGGDRPLAHLIAGALALDDLQPIFDSCAARAKYNCIFSYAS